MKIFIVIWEDRHYDTTAHPFKDLDNAIEFAKVSARKYCKFSEDYEELDCSDIDGWHFSTTYSCEGDCI